MIDLDLGKCEPAPGSALDDAHALPWKDMFEGALHAAYGMLRSPTEHESNPLIISKRVQYTRWHCCDMDSVKVVCIYGVAGEVTVEVLLVQSHRVHTCNRIL